MTIKNLLCILFLSFIVSGCTGMIFGPRPDLDYSDIVDACKGKGDECLVEEVDKTRFQDLGGKRFKYLEGHPPVNLLELESYGRLDYGDINPAIVIASTLLLIPMPGYTLLNPSPFGGIYACEAKAIEEYGLIHELTHCQGYKDTGFNILFFLSPDNYLPAQKSVMKYEGTEWTKTDFFKYYITEAEGYTAEEELYHAAHYPADLKDKKYTYTWSLVVGEESKEKYKTPVTFTLFGDGPNGNLVKSWELYK